MIAFLKNFLRRNVYLFLAGIILFLGAWLINIYLSGTSTTRTLRNSIESFLHEREFDFQKLLNDQNLIRRLSDKNYSLEELDKLMEKQYGILIYERNHPFSEHLTFWSDQSSVLPDSVLLKPDGDYFETLSNGQFEVIKHTFSQINPYPLTVLALIPVRWQYYISPENLPPEFVGFPSAENRVRISLTPTEFPVKNLDGKPLFYLQKTESYHVAKYSIALLLVVLIAVLVLLVIVHNMAHAIAERYGRLTGILFLAIVILLFRVVTYSFPDILHLRQYELFDPTIYSSNFILRSLGDLLINALLFCWIVLFVRQEMGEYTFPLFKKGWKRWLVITCAMVVLVSITFVFADIVQSLVADARISFNVTNFFSLTVYSVVGFIILASLALSYFFFTQNLLRLVRGFIEGNALIVFILVATIGLSFLTFHTKTSVVELNIYVLIWLLCYLWLIMRNLFSGLQYQLNVSEILFWLF
ncbi:MAG TPA: hypothetical protein VHC50_08885, partial [Puia sp.]|nr:hypothetical protein [Puia sp.]